MIAQLIGRGKRRIYIGDVASWVLVAISAAYSFSQLYWGLDMTDSFYYLSQFKSKEVKFETFGFQAFGHCWIPLFGETIISLRVANWLFYVTAFILAYTWLVPKKEWKKYLPFLALPFLLLPTFSLNVFNGDSCTLLIVVAICKLLAEWISKPTWRFGVALSLLFYLATLFRLPNIVAIILGFVPILLFADKKSTWIKYLFIGSVSTVLYILTYLLIVPHGMSFVVDDNHSLSYLISNYWKDANIVLSFLPICLLVLLSCLESRLERLWSSLLSVATLLFFVYWLRCEVKLGFACWNLSLFFSAFMVSISLLGIYKALASKETCLLPVIVLVMSFVNPAGSDTGLLKMVWLFVACLPMLLVYFDKFVIKKWLFRCIIGFMTIFCLYAHYKFPFGEPELSELTYNINNESVCGIHTSEAHYDFFNVVQEDVDIIGDDNILFYGERSFGLYEMLGIERKVKTTFFMNADNMFDIEAVRSRVEADAPIVFFMPYKPTEAKMLFEERTDMTLLEQMLLAEDYFISKKTDYYYIYSPSAEHNR